MGFPDFPIPESSKSYLPAKEMMEFLKSYSDTHNVTRHIKVLNNIYMLTLNHISI